MIKVIYDGFKCPYHKHKSCEDKEGYLEVYCKNKRYYDCEIFRQKLREIGGV